MVRRRSPYLVGLTRNTFLLAAGSFFADVSTEMLYPILPIFLTQTLHASGSIVGLIEGTAQATQNIVQGISGSLSDRLRKHKTIAMVGFVAAALAKPLIGIATAWPGVFGARLLDRVGTGTRSAPRDALVAESVDEEYRGRAFGLEGFGDNAGAFFGPLLAIALLFWLQAGFRTIFLVAVIPGLLAFVMVALVRERPVAVAAEATINISPRRLPASYWKYLLVTVIFGIGNSSNSFLILQTRDIGASLPLTIFIYAGFNLAAALISYPAGSLSDRWGRKNLLLVAYAVFLVAYLGFALSRDLAVVAVAFTGYGLIPRHVPCRRQSLCKRFCTGRAACERHRLVQRDRRLRRPVRQRRCRLVVGPRRPYRRVFPRRNIGGRGLCRLGHINRRSAEPIAHLGKRLAVV